MGAKRGLCAPPLGVLRSRKNELRNAPRQMITTEKKTQCEAEIIEEGRGPYSITFGGVSARFNHHIYCADEHVPASCDRLGRSSDNGWACTMANSITGPMRINCKAHKR
jgi:hypothetical protein